MTKANAIKSLSPSEGPFHIGKAAALTGVTAKMIRHYESLGLLEQAERTDSGYRTYGDRDLHVLRFIRHSRDLGFSLKQIEALLDLWNNKQRSSREVKQLATQHIQALDEKIDELLRMKAELGHLVTCCKGNDRPECPILERLGGT